MTVMPKLEDLSGPTFDPFEVDKLSTGDCPDPYPLLRRMMAEGPIHEGGYRQLFSDLPDCGSAKSEFELFEV